MTDPFSVAGSAVGVVSLGLTVCQGLIDYYEAYRSQDEEAEGIVQRLEGLSNTLEILQDRTGKLGSAHTATTQNVEKRIIACASGIKKLEKLLGEFQQTPAATAGSSFSSKVETQGRKALYPFRRSTIKNLDETVRALESSLMLAVLALQMYATHWHLLSSKC